MKEKKKSFILKLLSGVGIFLLIIILIFFTLYLVYFFTRVDERNYISKDYLAYIKVDSISKLYNNLIELRALDIILSDKQYLDLYKVLLEFKNSPIAKNKFLSSFVDMKVNIIITNSLYTSILLDMGFKSLLLKFSGMASYILKNNEDLLLKEFKTDSYKYYKLTIVKSNIDIYYSFKNNLLFLGLSEESIKDFYKTKESKNSIIDDINFYYVKSQVKKDGIAEIFVNSDALFDSFLKNNSQLKKVIDKFTLDPVSALSLNISNSEISLSTFTKSSTKDELVRNFLNNKPREIGITKYLPINTNFYLAINFNSFEEFYKLFLYFQEGKFDKTIENINNASKMLLNLSINELIFDWIGEEIGIWWSEGVDSPGIFIKIKDKEKLNRVFEKLTDSIFMEESTELQYKDVKLKKIVFPSFLNQIISLFIKDFDTPFFVIENDYIFFSMDIEPLSNLIMKYREDNTILFDKDFRSATSKISKTANIFAYFNMGYSIPKILQTKGILQDLFQLYEKGVMSINISNNSLKIDFSANGVNVKKARIFSGYPIKIEEEINSDLIVKDIVGSKLPELIYTTKNKRLYVTDFKNTTIEGFPVKISDNSNKLVIWEKSIVVYNDSGIIDKFDFNGNQISPFPIESNIKNSFNPVIYSNNLLLYSKDDKKIAFVNENGEINLFNYEFKSPLLSPPVFYNESMFLYPKSFSGTILGLDKNGNDIKGWPQEAGGIGVGSPVIANFGSEKVIIFITQSGSLKVWNMNGILKEELNLKFEGVFYTQPVVGDITKDKGEEIVLLNKDGVVTIVSSSGNIILEKKIKDADGKDRKLLLFNVTGDKYMEIFIYDEKNSIIALDSKLDFLPGFPVKGSNKPYFFDINNDGEYEMIAGSFDNNIYIYSIPK
ncbi:MAG TPA: hypothetical protein PLE45_09650 [Spirochaetota bacterium]|nr:hypothetical protein [Spirochaetota bacterium]HOL57458.1 hypothetical protein [Spirochaetota bacterium]HPP04381.1 hypothetical protein [Spirochaetota bacterium]